MVQVDRITSSVIAADTQVAKDKEHPWSGGSFNIVSFSWKSAFISNVGSEQRVIPPANSDVTEAAGGAIRLVKRSVIIITRSWFEWMEPYTVKETVTSQSSTSTTFKLWGTMLQHILSVEVASCVQIVGV